MIKRIITRNEYGVWASMQYISRSLQRLLPGIPGEYDTAINFLGIPDVLLNKVKAKKKIAWNHTDYSTLKPDRGYDRKLYNQLDYIVSVSEPCTQQFLAIYPEYTEKSVTIENIISAGFLKKQSEQQVVDFPEKRGKEIILLSVGRFSDAKNFDNVPMICKLIRDHGIDVKWYLIGYGGDEQLVKDKIIEAGMQNYVIILGKKENPYPYIKKCDLYVQPSRYEGKSVSVIEAQILNKPVVITEYPTCGSQLKDRYDGVIVPIDNEGCAEGIISVIQNKMLRQELIDNTKKNDYTNADEIEKIYQLMEDHSGQCYFV